MGPSRVVVWCVALCVVLVRGVIVWIFPAPPPPDAAPCCSCLVRCPGSLLCAVLGCAAVLVCCAVYRAVCCRLRGFLLVLPCCFVRTGWCCVLLPVVAGCSLLGLLARCCFPLACFGAGGPAWPRGSPPCCVLWFVVASRSSVVCPLICGAMLPRGVVLWFPAVRFALFCGRCGAVLLLGAVCGALCCSLSCCVLCPRLVALCHALLTFGRCLVPCSKSVFVGGSGCRVLFSGGACRPWCPCLAPGRPPCCLVCWCGVLWCPAPFAVSCGAVLPCGAVLSGCVVRLSVLLFFVFPFVLHYSAKIPFCFAAPLKTF